MRLGCSTVERIPWRIAGGLIIRPGQPPYTTLKVPSRHVTLFERNRERKNINESPDPTSCDCAGFWPRSSQILIWVCCGFCGGCPKKHIRAACLQTGTAPKSLNFKTKNGPKNDPKFPRKNLSLVLLRRISHRHYSKLFHREFPHKIKYFFTTRICRHGHAKSTSQNSLGNWFWKIPLGFLQKPSLEKELVRAKLQTGLLCLKGSPIVVMLVTSWFYGMTSVHVFLVPQCFLGFLLPRLLARWKTKEMRLFDILFMVRSFCVLHVSKNSEFRRR